MGVRHHVDGHVATITLDRPDALNAIDLDMLQAISDAVRQFEDDDSLWAAIITGEGKAFCAGADIGTTISRLIDDPRNNPYSAPPTIMRGQDVTKPLVAAVNGLALGGGLEVVLACDIRIAAENARFGAPEVKLGLIPGWGGTQRLPRQIPFAIAAQMVLTGEMINAEQALACGLINAVVPPEGLMDEARAWADKLCAGGPLAVRAAKRAMRQGLDLPLDEGLEVEQQFFDSMAYTTDVQEGIAAFREKRPANFGGK
jgi:enoyl-CoA hydratase/carnithine racemase